MSLIVLPKIWGWNQSDQMIWKNQPIFWKVAKIFAKQNNAKLETTFQTAYLGEKVKNLYPKVLPFLGYSFNEPTKSSLIHEKLPNLVTLVGMEWISFAWPQEKYF